MKKAKIFTRLKWAVIIFLGIGVVYQFLVVWFRYEPTYNVEFRHAERLPEALRRELAQIPVEREYGFMVSSDGTITGFWRISDFFGERGVDISIPSEIDGVKIRAICSFAFQNNGLRSVVIPDSVTVIKDNTFQNNRLRSVVIPDSVTSIGNSAFWRNELTSITIPDSVTSIGVMAFASNQLTSVTIPDSVIFIGGSAFGNNQLTTFIIPNSITEIGGAVFANNQLTSVTIPASITTIGEGIFMGNQLTSIVIPENVISIGPMAFYNNQLESITIPSSVRSIGGGAFAMNELTSITIGSDVEFARFFADPWNVYYPFSGSFFVDDDFNPVFEHFYNTNGRMAGTYVFTDEGWRMK